LNAVKNKYEKLKKTIEKRITLPTEPGQDIQEIPQIYKKPPPSGLGVSV